MSEDSRVGKIEKLDPISKSKGIDGEMSIERIAPNKEHFSSLVRVEKTGPKIEVIDDPAHVSLMSEIAELHSRVETLHKVTHVEISQQSKNVIAEMEGIKQKLSHPNLDIKTSAVPLLQNKLNHIDESLKIALSKVGVDYKPAKLGVAGAKPSLAPAINRFLDSLTGGQSGMQKLISEITAEGFELSPANMLAVQVKMNHIQQELEFFTSLLNKALESTKSIMNVQV